ncbi:antibiotic biosynthesis monooxygenase, partial [bacterium]|nr:antibiotic biosynthesis monooxygenase [bacterium]
MDLGILLVRNEHTTISRPPLPPSGIDPLGDSDPFGNYVSFTIWSEKKHFNAWRSGDAFKEAHGGTSLFAFVSTMVGSAMVLRGAPKPAFYDGNAILPAECFVACNQFFVPPDSAVQFEERWRDRTSRLAGCDGFVSFDLLRRDVKARGHGIVPMGEEEPSYSTCTIWRDRAAFEGWRTGLAFKEAHGSKGGGEEKEEGQPQKPPA